MSSYDLWNDLAKRIGQLLTLPKCKVEEIRLLIREFERERIVRVYYKNEKETDTR